MTHPSPLIDQHTSDPQELDVLKIADLTTRGLQLRCVTDAATVTRYAEIYAEKKELLPPIVVFTDGTQQWLADGHHRVAAAKKAGLKKIPGIIKPGSKRDALLYAASANRQHGLPLTIADKHHIVTVLLEDAEWRTWSDRQIAAQSGVSPQLVAKLRKTTPGAQTTVRKTKNGRTATVTNSRKQAKTRIADKQAGQESIAADDAHLAVVRDDTQHLAAKLIQHHHLMETKARILAALCLEGAHAAVDAVSRARLTQLCGVLDVHPGQLSRQGLIYGDASAGYYLLAAGNNYVRRAQKASQFDPVIPSQTAHAEPELITPDASVAAPTATPKRLPLADRQHTHALELFIEKLHDAKIKPPTTSALMALACIVGVEDQDERWSHDLEMRSDYLLAAAVGNMVAYHLMHGTPKLALLPDLPDLARLFGCDWSALNVIAQRTITE